MNETQPAQDDLDKKRKKFLLWFFSIVGAMLIVALICWGLFFRGYVYTDDSYVEGNQLMITPLRPGFVKSIHTDDTFLVKQGQLLIELDETDSRIAFDEAKDYLAETVRSVCQQFHQVFAYQSEIQVKGAQLIKTAQDLQHREDVLDAGGVSLEDYQHAVAFYNEALYSLKMTESLYAKALAMVQGTSIAAHPLVLAAANRLKEAWVQLYRCKIYAPTEGLVAQRTIQVGMWVKAGQPLMSVIPLDQIWVNANYKETQLKHMRIGQRASITADLYGRGVVYHGRIVGLPGGAGNAFSLLPPQNLSGNWIKIVQRLPVRVALDTTELKSHPLRIGLSMKTWVDLSNQSGPLVPSSSDNGPLYQTPIFAEEENGSIALIENIIEENLDPALAQFRDDKLVIEDLSDDAEI